MSNCGGWPNSGGSIGPSELNDAYKKGQFFIPAGALTGNPGTPPDFENIYQIPNAYSAYSVARYSGTIDEEAFFSWAFKADFVAVPTASMKLKISPLFTCENTVVAPDNKVQFAFGASNTLIGSSLDFSNSANEVDLNTTAPVTDVLQGGNTVDAQNAVSVPVSNDILSGGNMNFLQIMVERHAQSGGANDNYVNDILLLGVAVQFEVDFNNVAQWPT